jgi:hypothetical protein
MYMTLWTSCSRPAEQLELSLLCECVPTKTAYESLDHINPKNLNLEKVFEYSEQLKGWKCSPLGEMVEKLRLGNVGWMK